MKSFICDAGYKKVIIINIGDNTYYPSTSDIEAVRDHINNDRASLDTIDQWCLIPHEVNVYPEMSPNKKYIFYFQYSGYYDEEDVFKIKNSIEDHINDDDFIIYCDMNVKITRLNKNYIPFL